MTKINHQPHCRKEVTNLAEVCEQSRGHSLCQSAGSVHLSRVYFYLYTFATKNIPEYQLGLTIQCFNHRQAVSQFGLVVENTGTPTACWRNSNFYYTIQTRISTSVNVPLPCTSKGFVYQSYFLDQRLEIKYLILQSVICIISHPSVCVRCVTLRTKLSSGRQPIQSHQKA